MSILDSFPLWHSFVRRPVDELFFPGDSNMNEVKLTLIGGPTLLIEMGGLRLLTDPTFDPAGSQYHLGPVALTKTGSSAQTSDSLGRVDVVLLSHEQHSDNLDQGGRAFLNMVDRVYTTPQSAGNLGTNAVGLLPWQEVHLIASNGRRLTVTATPARHGPEGAEQYSGEVTGFVLTWEDEASGAVYISGDTVWYDELEQIPQRFEVRLAVLHLGAARLDVIGPVDLTMNACGALEAARVLGSATLVPVHIEGWAHFSESRVEVMRAFDGHELTQRLLWLEAGISTTVSYQ